MANRLEAIVIDGTTVWIEAEDMAVAAGTAARKTSRRSSETVKTSADGAETAAAAITRVDLQKTLTALITPVHKALAAAAPKEVTLELSLGLKGEVGVFVAKSEANASIKVTAKWVFEQKPAPATGNG
jgi:Trypsin-co-occurring domain 1